MARFNTSAATVTRTVNLAGGEAFVESPAVEFASILLTSMVSDQAYRPADAGIARVIELLDAVPPLFAAKAAVYARNEYGMRSISHVVAGELALRVRGEQWTRPFFRSVVRRPDDITEIVSYVIAKHGRRPLPNAMKDGLGQAFAKFDEYQLAKYRSADKALSLVDVVNLLHPKPVEQNAKALKALVAGTLRSEYTWEAKLSEAGKAPSEEAQIEAKAEAWGELVRSRKIGYFALLRNLRNIMQQAPDALPAALDILVDEGMIRSSLVLPFRFMTAAAEIRTEAGARPVLAALSQAAEISLGNVPRFDGRTLIAVDASGSMTLTPIGRGKTMVADAAALFGAVLYKRNDADLMLFASESKIANVSPDAGVLGLQQAIRQAMQGGSTNFRSIFQTASVAYDRVVILSDMQGWVGHDAPTDTFEAYVARVGKRPHVYSFDLAGMGTLQFPQQQVYCLAGFSDRAFEVMQMLETDKNALIKRIEAVEFS